MSELLLDNIKLLVEQKDTTVSNLEAKLGIGRSTIFKWDKTDPTLSKITKVADYLGVTVDTLCNVKLSADTIQARLLIDKFISLLTDDKIKLVHNKGVEYVANVGDYRFTYYEDSYNLVLQNGGVERLIRLNTNDAKTIKSVIHKKTQDYVLVGALEFLSTIN